MIRRFGVLVFIYTLSLVPARAFTNGLLYNCEDSSKFYIAKASSYFKEQNYKDALVFFQKTVRYDPTYYEAYTGIGLCCNRLVQYSRAISNFNIAIKNNARNKDAAYSGRAGTYFAMGILDSAIADYSSYIVLKPTSALAHELRGDVYRQANKFTEALNDYEHAIQLKGVNAEVLVHAGEVCGRLGKNDKALQYFTDCIQLYPTQDVGYRWRADYYRVINKYTESETDINKAISLNPGGAENYKVLIGVLLEESKFKECLNACSQYLAIDPSSSFVLSVQGYCQCVTGAAMSVAMGSLDKAIAIDKNSAEAYYYKGACYNLHKKYDDAVSNLSEAIKLDDKQNKFYQSRSEAYAGLLNFTEAELDLRRAYVLDTNSEESIRQLADFYTRVSDFQQAALYYHKLMAYGSNKDYRLVGFFGIGYCQVFSDEFSKGLKNIREYLLQGGAKTDLVKETMAIAYLGLDSLASAKKQFVELIDAGYKSYKLYMFYGITEFHLGQYEEAAKYFGLAEQIGSGGPLADMFNLFYGKTLIGLKQYDKAEARLMQITNPLHDRGDLYYNLALARTMAGKFDLALKDISKCYASSPAKNTLIRLCILEGFNDIFLGDYDKSIQAFGKLSGIDKSLKTAEDNYKILGYVGKEDFARCKQLCNDVLKIDSKNIIALRLLCYLNAFDKNYPAVIDKAEEIIALQKYSETGYTLFDKSLMYNFGVYKNTAGNKMNLFLIPDTSGGLEGPGIDLMFYADSASKTELSKGLITEIDKRMNSNKKYAYYLLRAQLKRNISNDDKDILHDYSQAISLHPDEPAAYFLRASYRKKTLNDNEGAEKDEKKAQQLLEKHKK